jgi:hypothetical protein
MARRKKIGGFDIGTDLNLILLAGGAAAVYFLGNKFGLWGSGSGSGSGAPANATTQTVNPQTVAKDLQSQIAQGAPPNYDATQYATWANSIFDAGNSFWSGLADSGSVLAIMDQLDNLADVYSLINAFGTKRASTMTTGQYYDLAGWIKVAFSDSAINSFNQQLGYNGVTWSWPTGTSGGTPT